MKGERGRQGREGGREREERRGGRETEGAVKEERDRQY